MLNRLRNSLYKFMYGRNGYDQLSQFLIMIAIIVMLPCMFIRSIYRNIFLFLFWVITIYAYFRIFSKNINKRQNENQKFISKINYLKTKKSQRKTYRFYTCPKCKTHLRVPKGVGKITITCKKCGYEFDKKA